MNCDAVLVLRNGVFFVETENIIEKKKQISGAGFALLFVLKLEI